MFSENAHNKLMSDIEKRIEAADSETKEKARQTLKKIQDNYRAMVEDKIERELQMATAAQAVGDKTAADQHRLRADIYRSVLDAATKA